MPLSITALKQRNILILIIIIFIGIFIALELVGILGGLLGAIIIYVIFRPLNIYLQEKENGTKVYQLH